MFVTRLASILAGTGKDVGERFGTTTVSAGGAAEAGVCAGVGATDRVVDLSAGSESVKAVGSAGTRGSPRGAGGAAATGSDVRSRLGFRVGSVDSLTAAPGSGTGIGILVGSGRGKGRGSGIDSGAVAVGDGLSTSVKAGAGTSGAAGESTTTAGSLGVAGSASDGNAAASFDASTGEIAGSLLTEAIGLGAIGRAEEGIGAGVRLGAGGATRATRIGARGFSRGGEIFVALHAAIKPSRPEPDSVADAPDGRLGRAIFVVLLAESSVSSIADPPTMGFGGAIFVRVQAARRGSRPPAVAEGLGIGAGRPAEAIAADAEDASGPLGGGNFQPFHVVGDDAVRILVNPSLVSPAFSFAGEIAVPNRFLVATETSADRPGAAALSWIRWSRPFQTRTRPGTGSGARPSEAAARPGPPCGRSIVCPHPAPAPKATRASIPVRAPRTLRRWGRFGLPSRRTTVILDLPPTGLVLVLAVTPLSGLIGSQYPPNAVLLVLPSRSRRPDPRPGPSPRLTLAWFLSAAPTLRVELKLPIVSMLPMSDFVLISLTFPFALLSFGGNHPFFSIKTDHQWSKSDQNTSSTLPERSTLAPTRNQND